MIVKCIVSFKSLILEITFSRLFDIKHYSFGFIQGHK